MAFCWYDCISATMSEWPASWAISAAVMPSCGDTTPRHCDTTSHQQHNTIITVTQHYITGTQVLRHCVTLLCHCDTRTTLAYIVLDGDITAGVGHK